MDYARLVLRFGLGIMFTAHGLQMVFGLFEGPGLVGFSKMLPGLFGVPPIAWSCAASFTCLLGGLALIIGFCTRIAVIPLLIFVFTGISLVHWKHGFFITKGGWEYSFVIAISLIALFFLGEGKYSITKRF